MDPVTAELHPLLCSEQHVHWKLQWTDLKSKSDSNKPGTCRIGAPAASMGELAAPIQDVPHGVPRNPETEAKWTRAAYDF